MQLSELGYDLYLQNLAEKLKDFVEKVFGE